MKELLYFSKNDCVGCTTSSPIVDDVARLTKVPLRKINLSTATAEEQALVTEYRVKAVPTLIFAADGVRFAGLFGNMITSNRAMQLLGF